MLPGVVLIMGSFAPTVRGVVEDQHKPDSVTLKLLHSRCDCCGDRAAGARLLLITLAPVCCPLFGPPQRVTIATNNAGIP
jgi:hypothetical protein